MNKWLRGRSRRERATLFIGALVLLVGAVLIPLAKRSVQIRSAQMEMLEQNSELLADYRSVLASRSVIEEENEKLSGLIGSSDEFLFERTGNNVMMTASMTRLLNQFGPDLNLNMSERRASLRNSESQIHFQVEGSGRYPDILNLIHQVERYRPIIVIDSLSLNIQEQRRGRGGRGFGNWGQPQPAQDEGETSEPTLRLRMNIHINCTSSEKES